MGMNSSDLAQVIVGFVVSLQSFGRCGSAAGVVPR
jgi:hypothetical protein